MADDWFPYVQMNCSLFLASVMESSFHQFCIGFAKCLFFEPNWCVLNIHLHALVPTRPVCLCLTHLTRTGPKKPLPKLLSDISKYRSNGNIDNSELENGRLVSILSQFILHNHPPIWRYIPVTWAFQWRTQNKHQVLMFEHPRSKFSIPIRVLRTQRLLSDRLFIHGVKKGGSLTMATHLKLANIFFQGYECVGL